MQRRAFVSALAASGLALPAWSQKYPGGPSSIVLPLQAGSASDVAVRHMAERLSQRLGQGFAVENVAAAAGLVGLDRLSRARVDGSVVAALNNSIMTILPHMQARNMKVDTLKDFVPLAGIANIPTFFAVPAKSPIRNVADLIKRARDPQQRITYSSGGVGSPQHLASEMFKAFSGVELTHIPFRGASQAALAVASAEVDLMSMALSLAHPFLQDGKVRLIGYCGPERHAQFRDIPTLQEQGVKGYDYSSWIGLFFHKDVPAEIGQVLAREAQAIGEDRDFQVQLIRSGLEPWPKSASELGRIVQADFARWKNIIEQSKIQAS
jgi:tripartite-type tricarboxylate transporter receptor subunit TctC